MKHRFLLSVLFSIIFTQQGNALDGKSIGHLISIPIIEGTGIYSSIKLLQTGDANATAASITNLSLMGINAGVGAYTLIFEPNNYNKLRTFHRILGFTVSAASIWLTVSAATNDDVRKIDKGISAGYTVLTVIPLFMFSF